MFEIVATAVPVESLSFTAPPVPADEPYARNVTGTVVRRTVERLRRSIVYPGVAAETAVLVLSIALIAVADVRVRTRSSVSVVQLNKCAAWRFHISRAGRRHSERSAL